MAEKKLKSNEDIVPQTEPRSEREELWLQYIENYKKSNPVKYARKEANGEFKKIPDSFKGILKGKGIIV